MEDDVFRRQSAIDDRRPADMMTMIDRREGRNNRPSARCLLCAKRISGRTTRLRHGRRRRGEEGNYLKKQQKTVARR